MRRRDKRGRFIRNETNSLNNAVNRGNQFMEFTVRIPPLGTILKKILFLILIFPWIAIIYRLGIVERSCNFLDKINEKVKAPPKNPMKKKKEKKMEKKIPKRKLKEEFGKYLE